MFRRFRGVVAGLLLTLSSCATNSIDNQLTQNLCYDNSWQLPDSFPVNETDISILTIDFWMCYNLFLLIYT